MLHTVNAGYTIIAARKTFRSGGEQVVLGVRVQPDGFDYVTWTYDPVEKAYFWGHYFDKANGALFSDAVKNFETRR